MKKLYLVLIATLIIYNPAFAQSITQGINVINPNARFGAYNVTENDKATNTVSHGKLNDLNYVLEYDRGIDDDFTVGGLFRYNAFLLGKDTAQDQINLGYGFDFCLVTAYHFIKTEHVDVYLAATMGFSYLKLINSNLNYQAIFTAGGVAYNLEFGARFYVSAHVGVTFSFGYSGYDYPNGTEVGIFGATDQFGFVFDGGTFGLGLCYKL